MKRNIGLIIALLPLYCFMLVSCGNEETYDFPGDTQNRVYIKPIENTVNGSNAVRLAIHKTPLIAFRDVLKLPVSSTLCADGDINVSFSVDNSLVEAYNAKFKTSYKALPMNAVELKNSGLKIPSNSTNSEGVVEISVYADAVKELSEKEYLMAVKLDKVEGNAVISSNRNISYIIVQVDEDVDNISDINIDEASRGKLLTADRTGWEVTSVNSAFSGTVSNIFDGAEKTNAGYEVYSYDDNTGFTMDMQKEYSNISAIRQHFYSGTYAITSSDIYTSIDNQNWTYQGHFNNNAEVANICFYAPIKARYIKTIVRKINRSVYIKELNIYIKD